MEVPVIDENWQGDLERWLAPFLSALRHKTRARMWPAYIEGLIGPGDRKAFSRWLRGQAQPVTISCTISLRAALGIPHHLKPHCQAKLTGRLVGPMPR